MRSLKAKPSESSAGGSHWALGEEIIRVLRKFIPSARRTPTVPLSPHSVDGFKINSSGISYRPMSKLAPISSRNGQVRLAKNPGPRSAGYSIPAGQNNQNENSAAADQVHLLGWATPRKTVSCVYQGSG